MTSSMPPIKIHVLDPDDTDDDVPLADVGVVTIGGERHLFLSPQSFGSAVRQVSSAMPDLPLEQVERLVREHCTELKDFDELLGPIEPAPPVDIPRPSAEPPAVSRSRGRVKKWATVAALLPAFAGTWALGHYATSAGPVSTTVSAPDDAPGTASDNKVASDNRNLGPEPFTAREFMDFSDAGKINCSPIDNLEAECTDADGMVMATKAATGPDSTIFMFSYGSERIGLRIFGTAGYAKTWTQQDASRELYPNMVRSGRYVLWGTDKARVKEYLGLLESSQRRATAAGFSTMGAAEPLPPRLAALTLGTLGLDAQDVRTILFMPQSAPVDAPVLMAAQAVLGVTDDPEPPLQPGAEDIVALAAGIEPPPVVTDSDQKSTHTDDGVVPATAPVTGGTPEPSTGTARRSDPEPTSAEKPEEPVAEKPTEPEPAPDPEPRPEQPPTARAQPSEPEQPTVPAELTPVDPAPPVAERPAPPQDPAPAEPQRPADAGGDAAGEQPVAADEQASADVRQEDDDGGELLMLPEAWVAPAA
ncbi:hypothetical protein [Streptomyces noursei]|uniref:hypothetical protein n=1 Tax=Streptomyces noursei TaxID=1971 RepID=UPI0016761338|nr:hypothetical protein [Streptomyces noursei]MCZ1014491.1 hypothetical protein [Streptomyces noursei]GGW95418.1 hypothetical protein GCM10010341_15820 [Streptomyces noursei]